MVSGIHHITAITRKIQANVDFYVGFLGLRLVKRTAGYEDADQLHLIYGDAAASPGSLVTFLAWEDGSPGRVGLGQPAEIALSIKPEAIGFWLTRALTQNIAMSGPAQEFGEPVLRLKDPDGIIVKLVGEAGVDGPAPHVTKDIAAADAIQRIRGATIFSEKPTETAAFIAGHFGYREVAGSEWHHPSRRRCGRRTRHPRRERLLDVRARHRDDRPCRTARAGPRRGRGRRCSTRHRRGG
jgi:phospholipase/carboxylesterase